MLMSIDDLQHTAELTYLDPDDVLPLLSACNAALRQIGELQSIDTQNIAPMCHPLPGTQALREDGAVEPSVKEALAKVAPAFDNDCYRVPNIIAMD